MECQFVDWLRRHVPPPRAGDLGIGDDAAVVNVAPGTRLVATTDMLMDGVDFQLCDIGARRAGRKALAVNLSDLAAMGAVPRGAVIAVALPKVNAGQLARELYEGLLPLAAEFQVDILGGDTNCWNQPLAISVTAFGELAAGTAPLTRAGARPGDLLLATGEFGGSILGRHLDFTPRCREIAAVRSEAAIHAAIDVSDGLSLDAFRLTTASGCGLILDLAAIPRATAAETLSQRDGRAALDHALSDGEDFELLLALTGDDAARLAARPPCATKLTVIGEFVAEPGLYGRDDQGIIRPLPPEGYEH